MRAFSGKEVGAHFRCKLIETRSRGTALLVVPAIVLGLAAGVVHSAAQGADAAHVEAVTGRVVASSQNKPTLLDALDVLGDRTQLDLQANSELLICHYQTRKLLKLRGPLRASVSEERCDGRKWQESPRPARPVQHRWSRLSRGALSPAAWP